MNEISSVNTNDMNEGLNNEIMLEICDEMGIIGPNTKLEGDITTKGHVTILGEVKGNVDAKGNVIVGGSVVGKIKGHNVVFENNRVNEVDVTTTGQVSVCEGVVINGKIECSSIKIQGTVHGNIKASDKVGLAETAVVVGDVTAKAMAMALGSKIKGCISVE